MKLANRKRCVYTGTRQDVYSEAESFSAQHPFMPSLVYITVTGTEQIGA